MVVIMSTEIEIPNNARGKVGLLVSFRKIRGLEEGRLGLVTRPVGWVSDLLGARTNVFAWQVMLSGNPVLINGYPTRNITVADTCLVPIAGIDGKEAQAIETHQTQQNFDDDLAEIKTILELSDCESPNFDEIVHRVYHSETIAHALEMVPIKQVLQELGFSTSHPPDGDSMHWKNVYQGREFAMHTAPGMFDDWHVWISSTSEMELCLTESTISAQWTRGKIALTILELWEHVFSSKKVPQNLWLGWFYRQHQADIKSLAPGLPEVWINGEQFRRALRWLREAYSTSKECVGPPADIPLKLQIKNNHLQLITNQFEIGVEFIKGWVDEYSLSLREVLSINPSTLRGNWLRIRATENQLMINTTLLSAVWTQDATRKHDALN